MRWFFVIILIAYIKSSESIDCDVTPKTTEGRLKNALFCSYDKTIRPVTNHENQTDIGMHLVLKNYEFDEDSQQLTLNAWFMLEWTDEHLKWKSDDYEKIKSILEDKNDIWMPDLSVYNSDSSQSNDHCNDAKCRIDHKGQIICILACSFISYCDMDFTYWPYDRQNCTIHMGSWLTPSDQLNYNPETSYISYGFHVKHNEYKMLYSDVNKIDGMIDTNCCGNQSFPSILFHFIIDREASFEEALILFPLFVLLAINLIGLWLEPGCYERFVLFITNVLLHFLLVQNVTWYIPKNGSEVPKIIYFIRDSTIMTAFLLLETIITRSIAHFQTFVPIWIEFTTHTITNSVVGKYFVSENLNAPTMQINAEDDTEALVEEKEKLSKENLTWKLFAKLIDRLLFLIYVIVYIIMYISLVPKGYADIPISETHF